MSIRKRVIVGLLAVSAAGFASWQASEGFTPVAVIPTKGDVPTIGHGSTRYEDGRKVRMSDTISPERAEVLARNLMREDERKFAATLPGVALHQAEYDVYIDFVGQYGLGSWGGSSMRRALLAGDHRKACHALLKYKYAAGYDCSTLVGGKPNRRCYGVWTRQLDRHAQCMGAQ